MHVFDRDTSYKTPFDDDKHVIVYKDDHDWKTAAFYAPQCGAPVKQVQGGKHDDVAPEHPNSSPWIPAKHNQMVFTCVGKSGRSYVINVMKALHKRNGLEWSKDPLSVALIPQNRS